MSPEEKRRLAVRWTALGLIALLLLLLGLVPAGLCLLLFFAGSCGVGLYRAEDFRLFGRLGLNPRPGLSVPPGLLRCLPGSSRTQPRAGDNSVERDSRARREALRDSPFSPRDLLMGSYLVRPENPPAACRTPLRPGEQLRDRLTRPNHGAPTPSRRLSFGDPVGSLGRFTITPQRHYPLQQTGTSSVGVLPPAQWDGFRKKNILNQRNTPVHSPVTVKIARPDNSTRSPFLDQLNSPGALGSPGFGVQTDPCSRETVLNVLRESRKRDVDDEDRSHAAGQKSKRRRHDSSGSSQSAFEPLLANGAPSQLVPKPGSLKRGLNASVLEESMFKRSRTSSISSMSGAPPSFGVPGSVRNPIRSSYSSSQGYPQKRAVSSLNLSPLTSPGSSRCQTPEKAAKKPREEDATSPSSVSSLKFDKTADLTPGSGKRSPAPETPVTSASNSAGSAGKRKRKVQLVSTRRGDQISMPPPPELGYTITVKDLDMEKKAVLSQIQKVLEEPEPEKPAPAPSSAPSVGLFSQLAPASSAVTLAVSTPSLGSLSTPTAGPPPASTAVSSPAPAPAPTIDLTVTPASTASAALTLITTPTSAAAAPVQSLANPLLESLKNMRNNTLLSVPSPLAATSAAPSLSTVTQAPISVASTGLITGAVKSEPALAAPRLAVSTPPMPAAQPATSTPSMFAKILAQPLQPSSSTFSPGGSSLFNLTPVATTAPPAYTSAAPPAYTSAAPPAPPAYTSAAPPAYTSAAPLAFTSAAPPAFTSATSAAPPAFTSATSAAPPAYTSAASAAPPAFTSAAPPAFTSAAPPAFTSAAPPAFTSAASAAPPAFTSAAPAASVAPTLGASSAANPASGFKPIFGAATTAPASAAEVKPTFKPIFGTPTSAPSAPATQIATSLFGNLTKTQPAKASVTASTPATQTSSPSLFGAWGSVSAAPAPAPASVPAPVMNSTFQFGAPSSAPAASGLSTSTNTSSGTATPFQFGALKPAQTAAPAAPQSAFSFGQTPAAQNSTTTPFTGFGMVSNTATTTVSASTTQATFGSSTFSTSMPFPSAATQAPAAAKPFTFGASGATSASAPFAFGAPASTAAPTFGTPNPPAFGSNSAGFAFGNTTAPSAAPAFGATTQTSAAAPAPTFTFGAAPATPQNSAQSAPAPAPAPSAGFNFAASLSGAQFGTPAPAAQTPGFSFGGANADNKPAFGTSTPAFGNAVGPVPFGSPGTPVQGFGAAPFGTPSASFSIGAGSKPSGTRQRLQARRQHVRKK